MLIQKYVCENEACRKGNRGRKRVWYRKNSERVLSTVAVVQRRCPACHEMMDCSAIQKNKPVGGVEITNSLAERYLPGNRERRGALVKATQRLRGTFGGAIRQPGADSLGLVPKRPVKEYAPPAQFNPNMRFTGGTTRLSCRAVFPPHKYVKVGTLRITASTVRAFGSTNQNLVMGTHINRRSEPLSAWDYAGRPSYLRNRHKSAEWCHLVGDCLGGTTTPNNLVAASFAANSEMMAIEHLLMGETSFTVQVEAYCVEKEYLADRIQYHVSCTCGDRWRRTIDCTNDHFILYDHRDLKASLKDFLSTHKRCWE